MNKSKSSVTPRRLFWLVLMISSILQFIIISYNHFSGFLVNENLPEFLLRWLISTSITSVFLYIIIYPDLLIVRFLNEKYPWNKQPALRILMESGLLLLVAVAVSTMATLTSHFISPYREGLLKTVITNALIGSVINIILIISLEAWLFFKEGYEAKLTSERLEKEISQIRFEVLKNQINPHFLFNSLNVLSGLIQKDPRKAQQFIDEFALIYRYVLETIEKEVVLVKEELDFIQSYMFLQQMRYGQSLQFKINISARVVNDYLPPLSMQVVVENAIKHNIINKENPLNITISDETDKLIVRNSLKRKMSGTASTGIGQKNLVKRYAAISKKAPDFSILDNEYVVILPLIKSEE